MTDGEIVTMYKQAKSPEAQRKILADLNNCSVDEIDSILERHGVRSPKKPHPPAHNKKIDDARALELHAQGATDAELMEAFGCTSSTISNWRSRHGLLCNRAPRPKTGPQQPVQVTVKADQITKIRGAEEVVVALHISGGPVPSEIVVRFGEEHRG